MMLSFAYILLYASVHVQGLGRTILDGDVFIEFIGAIYVESGNDSNSSCSNIEAETVQNIQAIKWTLSKLNEANYIPNVKIGLRVSQTCKADGESERLAQQLAAELCYSREQDVRIVGVIGSDYSSETEAISRLLSALPEEHRLLQFGYSSTLASLRNSDIYKNFFRTIPPDNLQVEVMLELLEALNWTYIAIVYDDDSYGRGGKDELLAKSKGLDVCFPVLIPVANTHSHVTKIETDIRDKIIGADIPITGILVFGSSVLADHVLSATENVIKNNPNVTRPVFLFSEAGGYIQGAHTDISKGAFVLSPPRRLISKFQEEWTNIFTDITTLYQATQSNTWIRDVYEEKFNCTLAETKDENTCRQISVSEFEEAVPDSVYNQYAIQAAMIFAKVVKNVFERSCPDNDLCAEFLDTRKTPRDEFIKELTTISAINFDNFGNLREIEEFRDPDLVVNFTESAEINLLGDFPEYEVYSHQLCQAETERTCLIKVAEYKKSKELHVLSRNVKDYGDNGEELLWPNIRKAQCPDGSFCSLCFTELADEILFIPGDMYIVGIVPIHSKGPTPLQCGDIKKGGLDIAETIRFAVAEAKTKPAAKIGIIIIDSCYDPQIIQEKILTLHKLGVYIDDKFLFVGDKIIGYIGSWTSDVSIAVAELTSRLQYPQISYASTAPVLSKRSLYPYFLRVPSPDEKQAKTIFEIVKTVGGDFIQIIFSAGAYGEGGRDLLLDLISVSDLDICVAQTLSVSTTTDGAVVLTELRRFPQAKTVVLFLGSFEFAHMLGTFNAIVKNEFLYISSEGWGTRFDVKEYKNLIGSITVTSQLTINEKLKDHMELLTPHRSNVDHWVRSYIEKEFGCYFEWSYDKTSRKPCQEEKSSLNVYTTDFRLDAWTPFAERAVTALLAGAETVLRDKCDGDTTTLCDMYRNSPHDVFEAIKKVRFRGTNGFDTRIFDDNGDGIADFQIYVVSLEEGSQYKKVGDSSFGADNEQVVLTFQTSVFSSVRGELVNSLCSRNIEKCNQCFPQLPEKDDGKSSSTATMVILIVLGVVCFVLVGILLFVCCRLGFCLTIDNGRLQVNETYITPVYGKKKEEYRASSFPDDNYDNIPTQTISYSRSPILQTSESSTSSFDSRDTRTQEVGSAGSTSLSTMGIDNEAFSDRSSAKGVDRQDLSARKDSYLELGSRKDSYLNSDLNLREHMFTKNEPLPAIPSDSV
ncbi:uncharacterized protein LOC123559795 isoform X3 [Mercenaria mercenaria]|uniref:uncharacterized protein LOC123559795 isoform X3 n=1 Tax=Mercenaria mercenaria TaxID=6596 RepID=UPI00234EB2A6|nr:uncharacterized protein LOC123559795 isoform X3 [Mercenaria mercenaria]